MRPILPSTKRLLNSLLEMTTQRDALAAERDDLLAQITRADQVLAANKALTEQASSLVQQVSSLTQDRNSLTGAVNAMTGQINDLVGQINELTGERNALTSANNLLTGERNALTTAVNDLTGELNALTTKINALTGECNALTTKVNDLTGERNVLTTSVNELTGERNALTTRIRDLTGEHNALTAQVNSLTGHRNVATATINTLTGERNALTKAVSQLTGERNVLTGKVTDLSRERNALTTRVNELTGERNRLVGQVNDLTGKASALSAQIAALTKRNDRLTAQINMLAGLQLASSGRRSSGAAEHEPAAQAPSAPAAQRGSRRRAKFLIVSNMRSGSTWLQTALGALPDVVTDYEMKWGVVYQPSIAHVMLDNDPRTVSEILDALPADAPVAGSKFVFDPTELSQADIQELRDKLGPDVRIVHLIRRYREIFISRRRGFYHLPNKSGRWRVGDRIGAAIERSDFDHRKPSFEPQIVPRLECFAELRAYLQNDISASLLRGNDRPFLRVDYHRVAERLAEIAAFIGSTAATRAIDAVLAQPPILKLPAIEAAGLIANIAELEPLFEQFEELRRQLLIETATGPDGRLSQPSAG